MENQERKGNQNEAEVLDEEIDKVVKESKVDKENEDEEKIIADGKCQGNQKFDNKKAVQVPTKRRINEFDFKRKLGSVSSVNVKNYESL